jgi:murein DD-endopeptidase MepM/ murein hydrolase activator NlpD
MAQRLILPINKMRVTAGYKNAKYKQQFGYTHYGVDVTDAKRTDKTVWASGKGIVTHCGWHPTGGNVIVIVYKDCKLVTDAIKDIVIRYYHLDKILVKTGQEVTKDTRIGYYGNTGASSGAHLHFEVDTDTKYPNYTPQTSKSNNVLKAGVDSTINPRVALWCKRSNPDCQYVTDSGYSTVGLSDINYSIIE